MKKGLMTTGLYGIIVFLSILAAWAGAATSTPEPAKSATQKPVTFNERAVADFYRGKAIQIVVGHGAGGGFDIYTRTIGRHIGKHIPGKPSIIVANMLGAGGLVAASHIYNRAPKDGTVIGNVIGGIVRSQLLGLQGVEFDASKFQYVGAPNNENSLLLMTKASGISRFEQLLEPGGKVLSIGDSGAATTNHTAALLTRDVLNANIKVVSGYTAAGGVDVAMDQGELGGQYNDWASIKTRTLAKIESGEWSAHWPTDRQTARESTTAERPVDLELRKDSGAARLAACRDHRPQPVYQALLFATRGARRPCGGLEGCFHENIGRLGVPSGSRKGETGHQSFECRRTAETYH